MSIVIILLLSVASYPDLTCSQVSTNGAQIQPVVAIGGAAGRFQELAVTSRHGPEPVFDTVSKAHAESEDLLFYFSSHAQAVDDTSGANLTPWLGLRPIGEASRSVLSGTSDSAQAPAGKRDKACSWSPGGAASHEPLPASGNKS